MFTGRRGPGRWPGMAVLASWGGLEGRAMASLSRRDLLAITAAVRFGQFP